MLNLTPLDITILVAYFVIVAVIGFISTRLIRNREDYFMGGRRFGKVLLTMFQFGSGTHADQAVGVSTKCYKVGFAGIWYQWVMLFTLPIYWLLAPIFRRARVLTTADFFERRFGTGFMLTYSFFALFICIGYTSMMLFGSAKLIEALTGNAISWQLAIVLMAGVSFLYGIAGGLIAAVWNDFFQGMLTIVMSLMIIPFFWKLIGGLHGFQAALKDQPNAFRMVLQSDMTIYWIIMMSVNSLFTAVAQPQLMSSLGSSRTEMDSRFGYVAGMFLKRLMTVPWALTGIMALALFGAGTIDADHAFGAVCRQLLPAGFVGLMLACVMASMMDNCAVNMLTFSGIYTNSIHRRLSHKQLSERSLVNISRIASVVFALVSVAISYAFKDINAAMRFTWEVVGPMGVVFFFGVLWPRANRYGAFACFAAGMAAMLVANFCFGWTEDKGLPQTISLFLPCGVVAGVVVSLLTPPEPKPLLGRFYLLLKTPLGREDLLHKAGLKEVPGTGTFEIAPQAEAEAASVPADKIEIAGPEVRKARRQGVVGFIVVTVAMLALLGATLLLTRWLAGG